MEHETEAVRQELDRHEEQLAAELLRDLGLGAGGREVLERLLRLATSRSVAALRPYLDDLAEVIGSQIYEIVGGSNAAFAVQRRTYGPWVESTNGGVWLIAGQPYRLEFLSGLSLQFELSTDPSLEGKFSLDPGERSLRVTFGKQMFPRHFPIQIGLSSGEPDRGDPKDALLIQAQVSPCPQEGPPILHLQYVLFSRLEAKTP